MKHLFFYYTSIVVCFSLVSGDKLLKFKKKKGQEFSIPCNESLFVRSEKWEKYPGTVWDYEVPPKPESTTEELECKENKVNIDDFEPGFYQLIQNGETMGHLFIEQEDGDFVSLEKYRQRTLEKRVASEAEKQEWQSKRAEKSKLYKMLHPNLLTDDFVVPNFLKMDGNIACVAPGVYLVSKIFREEFITLLNEELENASKFQNITWTRPNTMNNYGFMVDELGLHDLFDSIIENAIEPLRREYFSTMGKLDSHHAFTILYGLDQDTKLDAHMDLSEVTLNLCLHKSKYFKGGNVYFKNELHDFEFDHPVGSALFHIGQQWHGSKTLESGTRQNLIIWGRSSEFRSSPMENYFLSESTIQL